MENFRFGLGICACILSCSALGNGLVESRGNNNSATLVIDGSGIASIAAPQVIDGSGIANLVRKRGIDGSVSSPQVIDGSGIANVSRPQVIDGSGIASLARPQVIDGSGLRVRVGRGINLNSIGLVATNKPTGLDTKPQQFDIQQAAKILAPPSVSIERRAADSVPNTASQSVLQRRLIKAPTRRPLVPK